MKNALWMLKLIERFEMSSHSPCFCYFIYFEASEGFFSWMHCRAAFFLCCAKAITNNYSKSNNQKLPHEMLIQLLVVEDKMANSHTGFSWSGEERWEILLLSNTLKKQTQSKKIFTHFREKRKTHYAREHEPEISEAWERSVYCWQMGITTCINLNSYRMACCSAVIVFK